MLMWREIRRLEIGYALQLDRRLSAIDTDVGVATMRTDVVVRLQIGERVSLDVELIARNEILDDVVTALLRGEEFEEILSCAAKHGVVTRPPDEGVVARAALHECGAGTADKFRGSAAAYQRRFAADRDVFGDAVRMNDFQLAADDCGLAERAAAVGARYGGMTLLVNGAVASTEIDRVVTMGAVLADDATRVQRQRVVTAANDDLAFARDIDRIVTVACDYRALAIDGNVNVAAARNTDGGDQKNPPSNEAASIRLFSAGPRAQRSAANRTLASDTEMLP